MGWLGRLRHSRGYGVHSPFAYRLITECLREKAHYYDYDRLPPGQRTLYRLAAWLQPSRIDDLGRADATAALMACPPRAGRKPSPWTGADTLTLSVADASDGVGEALTAISQGTAIYITNCTKADRAALRSAIDTLSHGQTYSNARGTLIAIPLPSLSPQHFDITI